MYLIVNNLERLGHDKFRALARLGELTIQAEIEISRNNGLECIHMHGYLQVVLFFVGMEGHMCRNVFDYVETGNPSLPWEMGDLPDESIAQAQKYEAKMARTRTQQ